MKTSLKKTRSWLRNASRLFGRKNARRPRCSSGGCGWVTRERHGSLIFWSSAAYWVPARARSRARFSSTSTPRFSRRNVSQFFMEGLGKKLQEARLKRGLTLDEAGRMTKIRPAQLQEIENEDFSQFASLAYAKGFLLIYGKFLDVDVTPYLEAFETSQTLTTDGYSYLQDAPEPEPVRPVKIRRRSATPGGGDGRSSWVPLIIGILVLVIGFTVMKWLLQIQRLKPRPTPPPG